MSFHPPSPSLMTQFTSFQISSLNVWNWAEASSHQLENTSALRKRPPIASFIPQFLQQFGDYCTLVKIVEIVLNNNYSSSMEDIAALYSTGIIVLWSIQEAEGRSGVLKEVKKIELHNKVSITKGMKTKFQKNVTYFENNIFNDAALKELDVVKTAVDHAQNLQFIDLLFNGNVLISLSNQNFLTIMSIGLTNVIKEIIIPEAFGAVSITAGSVYCPGMVLIGLSDGTLKLQCIDSKLKSSKVLNEEVPVDQGLPGSLNLAEGVEKSCAFQNIVLNERKLYGNVHGKANLDSLERQDWSPHSSVAPTKSNELEIGDKIYLNGNYFKRSSIRNIQLFDEIVYFLTNNIVKAFNLTTEAVLVIQEGSKGVAVSTNCWRGQEMKNNQHVVIDYLIKYVSLETKILYPFQVIYGENKVHLHKVSERT